MIPFFSRRLTDVFHSHVKLQTSRIVYAIKARQPVISWKLEQHTASEDMLAGPHKFEELRLDFNFRIGFR